MRIRRVQPRITSFPSRISVLTRPAVVLSSLQARCPEPWPWAEYISGLISTILTFTIIQGEIVWRIVRPW